jgi:hypothetical protein
MRIGDIIHHKPSGEQWLVAKVCENGDIIAAGWPCTYAKASDCEMVEACGDIQHADMLRRLAGLPHDDPRYVRPISTTQQRDAAPTVLGGVNDGGAKC